MVDVRFADLAAGLLRQKALFIHDPNRTVSDGIVNKADWWIADFAAYYRAQLEGAVGFVGLLSDRSTDGCEFYVPCALMSAFDSERRSGLFSDR